MNRKYNDSEIIDLHSKGFTDREIAEVLDVKVNNLATKRRMLGLKPNKGINVTYELNKLELEILTGTILGDATIRYVHNKCRYPNLTFTHGINQKEYFYWLANKLSNLKSSVGRYDSKYVRVTGDIAERLVFTGKNMKCLENLRNTFYVDNKKIIPIDFVKKYFSDISLYILFMDDGSYDISNNSFIINTQCFSVENLLEFTKFLYDKFKLEFNIKSDNFLYLRHSSNDILYEILKSNNECKSMKYKYDSCRKTPLNRETPIQDNPVLNL